MRNKIVLLICIVFVLLSLVACATSGDRNFTITTNDGSIKTMCGYSVVRAGDMLNDYAITDFADNTIAIFYDVSSITSVEGCK